MDIRRKLAVTLAAMALAGQLGGTMTSAAAHSEEIEALQAYLAAGDLAGLAAFVEANPAILASDSPLGAVLADFLAAYRSGGTVTAFPPQIIADLQAALTQADSQLRQATKTAMIY
jgi:hypothetical protein